MYKTDKFRRDYAASEVQRSKSATNGSAKVETSEFGPVFDDSLNEKRKPRRKEKKKKKLKETGTNLRKESEGDAEGKRGKKKRRKKPKSVFKKTSNTNSDKKLKKSDKVGKGETIHKKSFSVNTPGQFKRILRDLPVKVASKFSRTEKNSLQSKGSSGFVESKEASLRGDSRGKRVLKLKNQKSKFSRTDDSAESDPKSHISNKKTTHKSQNSKDVSPDEKVSLETKRKLLINPTIISQETERRSEKDENPKRDENFESFAMINENNPTGKFDSFVPGFVERKESKRTPGEDRSIRLDKGKIRSIWLKLQSRC